MFLHTPSPITCVLCPTYFIPFFFNTLCHCTPFLNLRPIIFCLKPLAHCPELFSLCLFHYFLWEYRFWSSHTYSGIWLGLKTWAWCNCYHASVTVVNGSCIRTDTQKLYRLWLQAWEVLVAWYLLRIVQIRWLCEILLFCLINLTYPKYVLQ